MGDRLGLYRALAGAAASRRRSWRAKRHRRTLRARVAQRPGRRRLRRVRPRQRPLHAAARAGGRTDRFDSPAYLPGFFQIALGSVIDSPKIVEAARSGDGFGWHEHVHDVHEGCERFFRPGYNAHLVAEWLPALDGVVEKLEQRRARRRRRLWPWRIDDSDGAGVSAVDIRRLGLPRRSDPDRTRAARGGRCVGSRDFQNAPASAYSGNDYDLVTMFDCLHDMGDPSAQRATSATRSSRTVRG